MKTKIIFNILSMLAIFYSCENAVPEPELEDFMYVYMLGSRENPNVKSLLSNNDTVFTVGIAYGGTTNYNQGTIEAVIDVDKSLIEAYNSAHSTNYLPMPEGSYTLDKTTTIIADGTHQSDPLNLKIMPAGKLDLTAQYILPVTIKSIKTSDKLPLNEEMKTSYLVFSSETFDKDIAKDKWTIAEFSDQEELGEGAEINHGFAVNAIDGKIDTYWHTQYQPSQVEMPHWISINMNGDKKISGFYFTNRQGTWGAVPKEIKFEVSLDNKTWETVWESSEFDKTLEKQTITLSKPVIAHYFKVTISKSWSGDKYTYIAELDAF